MAAKIPDEKINEIRHSVDIVDVISDYVQLKKQGRNFFGLCPFHGENTPSFSVSADKQIFHCFGCGAGGNVFTFMMDMEGIPFLEAAAKIAEKGNVQLDIEVTGNSKVEQLPKDQQQMFEAHELLAKFYHHLLVNTNEGAEALEYLLGRGFTKESIAAFQVGYSLPEWNFAGKFLEKRGFPLEIMEKAGLIIQKENDGTYFDRFRNRLMFPLIDTKGRVAAFSARALAPGDQPKFLNTPETPIFNKSSLLYNYHEARGQIRKQGYAVLFEGFADVISAHTADVRNGVAVMGTSLTDRHVNLLRRLSDSVVLCFDSDQAGKEAAFRAGTMLETQGLSVTVAAMPDGMDPDDYIRSYGPDKFRTDIIGNGLTWMSYKLRYFRQGKNLQNEGEMLKYIEEVLKEISKLDRAVEQDLYVRQLAEEFSLSLDALKQQLQQMKPRREQASGGAVAPVQTESRQSARLHHAGINAERHLIARMLRDEELANRVTAMLGDAAFYNDEHQAIMTYLFGYYEDGNPPDPIMFLNHLPDKKLRRIVTEIEMMPINEEITDQELKDYVEHVLKYPKLLMIKEKQAEQKAAERKKDFAKALQIGQEILNLRKSL